MIYELKNLQKMQNKRIAATKYLSLLDLTSLKEDDTEESIAALCCTAQSSPSSSAAVCVYPKWVEFAKKKLSSSDVLVATVVNFPDGSLSPDECAPLIQEVKRCGADEIDFVINWKKFRDTHDEKELKDYIERMVELCRPCTTKCILETSMLEPSEIRTAARVAIQSGVNFLKTSTGKVQGGATAEAISILAQEIRAANANVGIKPSGGIRSFEDCERLWTAAADLLDPVKYSDSKYFRFGTSGQHLHSSPWLTDTSDESCLHV